MYKFLPILLFAYGLCGLFHNNPGYYDKLHSDILNEIDTTFQTSDEFLEKIKDRTDDYIEKLYKDINDDLFPFINPEAFLTELQLSAENTNPNSNIGRSLYML